MNQMNQRYQQLNSAYSLLNAYSSSLSANSLYLLAQHIILFFLFFGFFITESKRLKKRPRKGKVTRICMNPKGTALTAREQCKNPRKAYLGRSYILLIHEAF